MTADNKNLSGDEQIGELISSAGPGSTASPEVKQRIYAAVHARWQSELAGKHAESGDEPDSQTGTGFRRHRRGEGHRRRRAMHTAGRFRALGIAATVALAAISVYWLESSQIEPASDGEAGRFALIEGGVELLRPDVPDPLLAAETAGPIRFGDRLLTGADGRVALRLQDNLLLRVNLDSELIFSSPDEIELVAGTIYIDTGDSGAGRSLRVQTELGQIEHLGTQYEVRLADSALRVRVREGSIAYNGASTTQIGEAGEQIDIDSDGLAAHSDVAPNDPDWQWVSALATLPQADEYRISDVLAWVARELGLQLDFASFVVEQRVANQTLVGLEGLNPNETLDVVQRTADIVAEISGETLLVRD